MDPLSRAAGTQGPYQLITPPGKVSLYAPAVRGLIERLAIDPGMGAFCDYRDPRKEHDLLREIADASDGYVAVAVFHETIVGFVLLCRPGSWERWALVADVFELSLEVARSWRQLGLAHQLLRLVLADATWDRRVVVAQGYHWHWDIEHTGLAVGQYRQLFQRLFSAHDFVAFDSDEPEIYLDRGNILMARVGSRCPSASRRGFYADLFRRQRKPAWLEALLKSA